jgi:hypothetical protein
VRYLFKWIAAYEKTLEIKQFSKKMDMNRKIYVMLYMKILIKNAADKLSVAIMHRHSKK